jgi:hypothetical protein
MFATLTRALRSMLLRLIEVEPACPFAARGDEDTAMHSPCL